MSLAWLSKIIKDIKPGEDGKIDFAAVSASVEAEMVKHMVPLETHNAVVAERDTAQTQLESVKGKDLVNLQAQLDEEKKGRKTDKQTWTVRSKLEKMGAQDVDYLMYKAGDPSVLFDEEGKWKDEKAFEETLKKDYANQFTASHEPYTPRGGDTGGGADLGSLSMEDYIKARTEK